MTIKRNLTAIAVLLMWAGVCGAAGVKYAPSPIRTSGQDDLFVAAWWPPKANLPQKIFLLLDSPRIIREHERRVAAIRSLQADLREIGARESISEHPLFRLDKTVIEILKDPAGAHRNLKRPEDQYKTMSVRTLGYAMTIDDTSKPEKIVRLGQRIADVQILADGERIAISPLALMKLRWHASKNDRGRYWSKDLQESQQLLKDIRGKAARSRRNKQRLERVKALKAKQAAEKAKEVKP